MKNFNSYIALMPAFFTISFAGRNKSDGEGHIKKGRETDRNANE